MFDRFALSPELDPKGFRAPCILSATVSLPEGLCGMGHSEPGPGRMEDEFSADRLPFVPKVQATAEPQGGDETATPVIDYLRGVAWADEVLEASLARLRRLSQGEEPPLRKLAEHVRFSEPVFAYRFLELLATIASAGEAREAVNLPRLLQTEGPRAFARSRPAERFQRTTSPELPRDLWDRGHGVSMICVTGASGIGKTAYAEGLAEEFAERRQSRVLQVKLTSSFAETGRRLAKHPDDALAELLRQLGVPAHEIPPERTERRSRYLHELAREPNWPPVIVLDDVLDGSQVLPLLPRVQGFVVATSREPLPDLQSHNAGIYELAPLDVEEAIRLIAESRTDLQVEKGDRAARMIAELCEGLPAAVHLVAASLRRATDQTIEAVALSLSSFKSAISDGTAAVTAAARLLGERLSEVELRIIAAIPGAGVDARAVATATGLAPGIVGDAMTTLLEEGILADADGDRVRLIPDIGESLRPGPSSAARKHMGEAQMQRCQALSKLLAAPDLAEFPRFAEWAAERVVEEGPAIVATLPEAAAQVSGLNRQVCEQFLKLTEQCPDWPEVHISMRPVLAIAGRLGDSKLEERAWSRIDANSARMEAAPTPEWTPEPTEPPADSVPTGLEHVRAKIPIVEGPGATATGPVYFGKRAI
jgi:hypothetical protein